MDNVVLYLGLSKFGDPRANSPNAPPPPLNPARDVCVYSAYFTSRTTDDRFRLFEDEMQPVKSSDRPAVKQYTALKLYFRYYYRHLPKFIPNDVDRFFGKISKINSQDSPNG